MSSRLLSKNLKIKIYKTIILPVVLHGCETWSLILREEYRLRVFENRILKDEKGEWRRINCTEIHSLIVRFIKSTRLQRTGHVARVEEGRSAYKFLTGKPLGRLRRRWEDSTGINLEKIVVSTKNWVDSARD